MFLGTQYAAHKGFVLLNIPFVHVCVDVKKGRRSAREQKAATVLPNRTAAT